MKYIFFNIIKVKNPCFSSFQCIWYIFKFIAFHKQDAWKFYDSLCKRSNWPLSVFFIEKLLGLSKYPYRISNKERTMENFQITAIDAKGLCLVCMQMR